MSDPRLTHVQHVEEDEPLDEPLDGPDEPLNGQNKHLDGPDEPLNCPDEPLNGPNEPLDGPDDPLKGPDEPFNGQSKHFEGSDESLNGPDDHLDGPDEPSNGQINKHLDSPDEPLITPGRNMDDEGDEKVLSSLTMDKDNDVVVQRDGASESQANMACTEDGEEDPGTATMEDVMKALGVPGRYQLVQIIVTCFCVTPFAFVMLNFVFIGYEPTFTCNVTNMTELLHAYRTDLRNGSYSEPKFSYDSCAITVVYNNTDNKAAKETSVQECQNGYHYGDNKHISMVSEWDLVCDKRGVAEFVQTAINFGMVLSSAFVTYLADRYGRKYVFLINIAAIIVTEFALFFANSIYIAIALRFLTGISAGAMYVIHNVVSSELIISKYRQIYGQCNCMLWSINVMLVAGVAFIFKNNWRYLQLITALCGIPAFFITLILNETPLWYYAHGQYELTRQTLVKACKMNGKKAQEALQLFQSCVNTSRRMSISKQAQSIASAKYSIYDIIRNPKLLHTMLILCLVWFTNATAYFGLYLTSSTLDGDRFLNFFLMALLEIPSSVICMFILTYLGRRTVVLIFIALSAVSLLVSTCLVALVPGRSDETNASTVFFLFGKFAIGSSYNVLAAYTPEVFPTTFRSTGTGICAAMACAGAMLAPFLNVLFKMYNWAPGALLTSMCVGSFFLFWTIPETRGRQLPTTVDEMQSWK